MTLVEDTIQQIADQSNGKIVFLNMRAAIIGPFRFLGATMWSHVATSEQSLVEQAVNDFRLIHVEDKKGQLSP